MGEYCTYTNIFLQMSLLILGEIFFSFNYLGDFRQNMNIYTHATPGMSVLWSVCLSRLYSVPAYYGVSH